MAIERNLTTLVSTHSRSKAAATCLACVHAEFGVSTHSRSKAAASATLFGRATAAGFNSQPLEGGCILLSFFGGSHLAVSTHSRSKAAAFFFRFSGAAIWRFQLTAARRRLPAGERCPDIRLRRFNSQPLEGGCGTFPAPSTAGRRFQLTAARRRLHMMSGTPLIISCFNSQPLEGGCQSRDYQPLMKQMFQLTAARRRLQHLVAVVSDVRGFQLTAARRRLPAFMARPVPHFVVSTHSRSKAAAHARTRWPPGTAVSTHSRSKAAA